MAKKMSMEQIRKGIAVALEQSIEDKYQDFVESLTESWLNRAKNVAEKAAAAKLNLSDYIYKERDGSLSYQHNQLEAMLAQKREAWGFGPVTGLNPNAAKVAKKLAIAQADGARAEFISKNTMKLENIIHNKSLYGVDGVEVTPIRGGASRGIFEGRIELQFSDGMKFTVVNQIVSKVSVLGKWFYQFPTTFHNVHMPDGKVRAMIPENEMLEIADPDNIGKRIPKNVEVEQEEKQKRKDDRDAKRDVKRQKALARFTFEGVDPDGGVHRSDPTDRELTILVLRRDKRDRGVGPWGDWSTLGGGFFTDVKKADAMVKRQIKEITERYSYAPDMTHNPDHLEFVKVSVRRLPHPDWLGDVGDVVEHRVLVTRTWKHREGYVTVATDAENNDIRWIDRNNLAVDKWYTIKGVIEQADEDDKYMKKNFLGTVEVLSGPE